MSDTGEVKIRAPDLYRIVERLEERISNSLTKFVNPYRQKREDLQDQVNLLEEVPVKSANRLEVDLASMTVAIDDPSYQDVDRLKNTVKAQRDRVVEKLEAHRSQLQQYQERHQRLLSQIQSLEEQQQEAENDG